MHKGAGTGLLDLGPPGQFDLLVSWMCHAGSTLPGPLAVPSTWIYFPHVFATLASFHLWGSSLNISCLATGLKCLHLFLISFLCESQSFIYSLHSIYGLWWRSWPFICLVLICLSPPSKRNSERVEPWKMPLFRVGASPPWSCPTQSRNSGISVNRLSSHD